jgi:hypothetical protein
MTIGSCRPLAGVRSPTRQPLDRHKLNGLYSGAKTVSGKRKECSEKRAKKIPSSSIIRADDGCGFFN